MIIYNETKFFTAGNYTCQPSSGHSASVIVHVVDGQ